MIVDNLSRRKIDIELGCESLTPIASIEERCRIWNSIPGSRGKMKFKFLDLQRDYAELVQVCICVLVSKYNDFNIFVNPYNDKSTHSRSNMTITLCFVNIVAN